MQPFLGIQNLSPVPAPPEHRGVELLPGCACNARTTQPRVSGSSVRYPAVRLDSWTLEKQRNTKKKKSKAWRVGQSEGEEMKLWGEDGLCGEGTPTASCVREGAVSTGRVHSITRISPRESEEKSRK